MNKVTESVSDNHYVGHEQLSEGNHKIRKPRIVYVDDKFIQLETIKVPKIFNRALMLSDLINSYGLFKFMKVIESIPATEEDIKSFHASDYVEFLKNVQVDDELDDESSYGLGYDCPVFPGMFQFVSRIAGATLTAVRSLTNDNADIAINWAGGWHHAQRDEAAGFCYVNDIVIGIQELRSKFGRVLYIDVDVHHGNGVEFAFASTATVLTLSLHEFEPGFYPGTGSVEDIGFANGKYHSINVPLHEGVSDDVYIGIFKRITNAAKEAFKPGAIVVQCGCDSLAGDPEGNFNLTNVGLGKCVRTVLDWKIPTLFLGGGGYNISNAVKCWTYLTSIIIGHEISCDIPDDFAFFRSFGPDYTLDVEQSHRKDCNTEEYVNRISETVLGNVKMLQSAYASSTVE